MEATAAMEIQVVDVPWRGHWRLRGQTAKLSVSRCSCQNSGDQVQMMGLVLVFQYWPLDHDIVLMVKLV